MVFKVPAASLRKRSPSQRLRRPRLLTQPSLPLGLRSRLSSSGLTRAPAIIRPTPPRGEAASTRQVEIWNIDPLSSKRTQVRGGAHATGTPETLPHQNRSRRLNANDNPARAPCPGPSEWNRFPWFPAAWPLPCARPGRDTRAAFKLARRAGGNLDGARAIGRLMPESFARGVARTNA